MNYQGNEEGRYPTMRRHEDGSLGILAFREGACPTGE
jgi:hypothetical protein